jgi:hypothetical protein
VTSDTKLGTRSRGVHGTAKLANGLGEPDEHCTTDDRMADMQFLDLWNGGHGTDVARRESMARMDFETERGGVSRASHERVEVAKIVQVVHIRSGVQLDRRRTELAAKIDG